MTYQIRQSPLRLKSFFFYPLAIICTLYLLLGLTTSTSAADSNLVPVATFEGATLYTTTAAPGEGALHVIRLSGSFREMGRQYGALLGSLMQEFYEVAVNGYLIAQKGLTYDSIRQTAQYYYDKQPQYARDFISAMAETSGLSRERQKIMASLMYQLFVAIDSSSSACSTLMAWSGYTGGGPMVIGRNWDTLPGPFPDYAKYLTVAVYNPAGYANSLAEVNYAGFVSCQTGMNKAGIFIDYQSGSLSDPLIFERTPGPYHLFSYLLNYTSLDQIDQAINATLPEIAAIINVAEATRAYVYEWATYARKRRISDPERPGPGPDGLLVATNHFVDPSWTGLPIILNGFLGMYTKERRANLLARGEQFKGALDPVKMRYIFDRTTAADPDPGPCFPDHGNTVIQVVAVPANLELWVKARGYSDWQLIPLGSLFSRNPPNNPAINLFLVD
ncbi:MAG: C45 family peptidase [Thermodesulfobacteriota bacterium]